MVCSTSHVTDAELHTGSSFYTISKGHSISHYADVIKKVLIKTHVAKERIEVRLKFSFFLNSNSLLRLFR